MENNNGVVLIHGTEYKTVSLRVNQFRADHNDWSIESDIISISNDAVVIKSSILNESGRVLATGIAEEKRNVSMINKTSALENCETSAVGRALAFLGYAGSEIASAEELASAIKQNQIEAMSGAEAKDILDKYPDFFFTCFNDNDDSKAVESIGELTKLELRALERLMQGSFDEDYKVFMRNAVREAKKIEEAG